MITSNVALDALIITSSIIVIVGAVVVTRRTIASRRRKAEQDAIARAQIEQLYRTRFKVKPAPVKPLAPVAPSGYSQKAESRPSYIKSPTQSVQESNTDLYTQSLLLDSINNHSRSTSYYDSPTSCDSSYSSSSDSSSDSGCSSSDNNN